MEEIRSEIVNNVLYGAGYMAGALLLAAYAGKRTLKEVHGLYQTARNTILENTAEAELYAESISLHTHDTPNAPILAHQEAFTRFVNYHQREITRTDTALGRVIERGIGCLLVRPAKKYYESIRALERNLQMVHSSWGGFRFTERNL